MKQLQKRVAGTFGLRLTSTSLSFLTSILLAQMLGASDFGTYVLVVSWINLLVIPATLGFDGLLGREVAIYEDRLDWGNLKGLLKSSSYLAFYSGIVLALVASLIVWFLSRDDTFSMALAFGVAMISLPLISLRKIHRGTMRGLHQIVWGLLPEMLLSPLSLLLLIGGFTLFQQEHLSAVWALAAYSIASGVALVASLVLCSKALPANIRQTVPKYQIQRWVKCALPFMLIESVNVINSRVDILMLGALSGVEAAGVYVPVNRGAELISFATIAFLGPLSPTVAGLSAGGKIVELQTLLSKTNRMIFFVSILLTVMMIGFGRQYLSLFGTDFVQGVDALTIRCVGRFLFTTVGLSPMVLSMSGNANLTAISGFSSAILNIILNALLIPHLGLNGAAIATATSLLFSGILNSIWAYREVGVNTTTFRKF